MVTRALSSRSLLEILRDELRHGLGLAVISERHLGRSFTCQKLSIYRPIIQALVDMQVLELTPEGLLQLGRRPFEDAQPALWSPLAMAV